MAGSRWAGILSPRPDHFVIYISSHYITECTKTGAPVRGTFLVSRDSLLQHGDISVAYLVAMVSFCERGLRPIVAASLSDNGTEGTKDDDDASCCWHFDCCGDRPGDWRGRFFLASQHAGRPRRERRGMLVSFGWPRRWRGCNLHSFPWI